MLSLMLALALADTDRVLIVAPHPDDEVLCCAGLIADAVRRKIPVEVVFMTNGDDNEEAFAKELKHPVIERAEALKLGEQRRGEAQAAGRVLGVSRETFLGYPDRGLEKMWSFHWRPRPAFLSQLTRARQVEYRDALRPGAEYHPEEALEDLARVMRKFEPTKVFAGHPADHHPDHRATWTYAEVALRRAASKAELWAFLVHAPGWPRPRGLSPEKKLEPPADFAKTGEWASLPLDEAQRTVKLAALEKHRSQVGYSGVFLEAFVRANELFVRPEPR